MPPRPDAEERTEALLQPLRATADAALAGLAREFGAEVDRALADSTAQKYAAPWRDFVAWWRQRRQPGSVYDAPPEAVGLYLYAIYKESAADRVGDGRVRTASAAIHTFFAAAGRQSPTEHAVCAKVRQLAARHLVPRAAPRDAFTSADLARFVEHHGGPEAGLLDVMMCAAVALMFYGFLRFDDLCAVCVHADLLVVTASHLEVFIPRSKTDQLWRGSWVVVGRIPGSRACPVGLVERLLERGGYLRVPRRPEEDVGPLLRVVQFNRSGGRLQRLVGTAAAPVRCPAYSTFAERLKDMCAAAGITAHITTHSMRIGGNSTAADRGVTAELRQAHGRWLSPAMVDLYTRRPVAVGMDITRRMAGR